MKKAVVVGGSNGIGLAIVNTLIEKDYHVTVLDLVEPDNCNIISEGAVSYTYCDLQDFDEKLFENIAEDNEIDLLMVTAGLGRVSDFEYIHISEIEKLFEVNTIACIKILKIFYNRIRNNKKFYCGVMGSIAGLICSPMFSIYAASKAAICRFTESVNIELEQAGFNNKILNVSPGSISGTRFYGKENNLSCTLGLAKEIVDHLINSDELFIPDYDSVYKDVITRYQTDGHAFGISSYQYKKQSGRAINENKAIIGYLSGTFDLFHIGHLNLIKRAKEQCDYLIVGVHKDASHKNKEAIISFEERMAIVKSVRYVDRVVPACSEDSDAWDLWHYNKLFVGSDYKDTERFKRYEKYFQDKNTEIVYFPYTVGTSSTQLRKKIAEELY